METSDLYATDLRELGIRLSAKDRWLDAARTYRAIVKLDETDAYAWEYLGYNLARADSDKHAGEILSAYTNAHACAEGNPLFHGRLLGFRGRQGMEIDAEFTQGLLTYRWRGQDRFAYEVLGALLRCKRVAHARKLFAAHPFLRGFPEVRRVMEALCPRSTAFVRR